MLHSKQEDAHPHAEDEQSNGGIFPGVHCVPSIESDETYSTSWIDCTGKCPGTPRATRDFSVRDPAGRGRLVIRILGRRGAMIFSQAADGADKCGVET